MSNKAKTNKNFKTGSSKPTDKKSADLKPVAAKKLPALDNIPTLKARQDFFEYVRRTQSRRPVRKGRFPSTEEMQREDRER